MSSPWSDVSTDFLSVGDWAIGQGPGAPDRRLFRNFLKGLLGGTNSVAGDDVRLLELGPGSGIDLRALVAEGLFETRHRLDYVGVDLTEGFVEALREEFPERSFAVGDVLDLPEVLSCDVAYARHVLEHVSDGYAAIENLLRASDDYVFVSWFIRPTWDEREVGCVEAEGFLHQTYSARRMIEHVRELGAELLRIDFDHYSTKASVWIIGHSSDDALFAEAAWFATTRPFLRSIISPPEAIDDRRRELVDVVAGAASQRGAVADVMRNPRRFDEADLEASPIVRALDRAESAARSNEPLRRYGRLVLWGFTESLDSMRHIFRHYAAAGTALGLEVLQLPNVGHSVDELRPNDLVLAVDVEGRELRAVADVDYVLHNFDASFTVFAGLEEPNLLRLQVYTSEADEYGVAWDPVRRFDAGARTLFQPWGTDLLVEDFLEPAWVENRLAYFVGAVWDDGGLGNASTIDQVALLLAQRGITLELLTHVSDAENAAAVRASRVAPAFAGPWQVEKNYLPCRVFKNVSYGKVALTNVPKFRELFAGASLASESIETLLDEALALSEADHAELVIAQQAIVARYTYRESLRAIARALEEGK